PARPSRAAHTIKRAPSIARLRRGVKSGAASDGEQARAAAGPQAPPHCTGSRLWNEARYNGRAGMAGRVGPRVRTCWAAGPINRGISENDLRWEIECSESNDYARKSRLARGRPRLRPDVDQGRL